jgi:hypothetical protein
MLTLIDCISGPLRTVCVCILRNLRPLGLTINSRFAWDDQINIACCQVYFTLKRLWTTASLTVCHCFSTVIRFFPRRAVGFRYMHIILVRVMSFVFVGLSTYRATLLVYWVFHWAGTTASGYAAR